MSARRNSSIATVLAGRDNALNAIRLVLAAFVIIDHSYKVIDLRPGPWPYLGAFAVDAFFAISGYLIAGSRSRMGASPFLWRRGLRLMPAYWAALVVTAVVVAPWSAAMRGTSYDWSQAWSYVVRNSLLVTTQMGIGDTPSGVAYHGLWNAPLWSLPYEAGAYVVFGLLVAFPGYGARAAGAVSGLLAGWVLLAFGVAQSGAVDTELPRLWSYFAAGVLLWFLRERLPSTPWAALAATLVIVAGSLLDRPLYLVLTPVPLAFLLLWLGARLPLRMGVRNDISYGMYVQAFPLQQLLVIAGVAAWLGPLWFAVVSVVVTVPMAWASWLLVERPALQWRRTPWLIAPRRSSSSTTAVS
jgi:peptidoglycan/LPS O-acetylase OafA/YrhL